MKISFYDEEFDYSLEDETLSLEKAIREFYDLSSEKASFFHYGSGVEFPLFL